MVDKVVQSCWHLSSDCSVHIVRICYLYMHVRYTCHQKLLTYGTKWLLLQTKAFFKWVPAQKHLKETA